MILIKRPKCVLCNKVGEYIDEKTKELLCKEHFFFNEEIKNRKKKNGN